MENTQVTFDCFLLDKKDLLVRAEKLPKRRLFGQSAFLLTSLAARAIEVDPHVAALLIS